MNVDNGTQKEQQAPHQERDVDTSLQDLDITTDYLIDLERVMNRSEQPQCGSSNKQVQSMLL